MVEPLWELAFLQVASLVLMLSIAVQMNEWAQRPTGLDLEIRARNKTVKIARNLARLRLKTVSC